MISVGQYHRPHYYITEKIFLHPNFRRRVASPRFASHRRREPPFPVLHGVRARAREKGTREDDPRAVRQTREDALFASDDKYVAKCTCTCAGPADTPLPSSQLPADPFVKLALPHTFCRAPDYYNTLRITRSSAPAEPTEAVGTPSFRGSFRDRPIN